MDLSEGAQEKVHSALSIWSFKIRSIKVFGHIRKTFFRPYFYAKNALTTGDSAVRGTTLIFNLLVAKLDMRISQRIFFILGLPLIGFSADFVAKL